MISAIDARKAVESKLQSSSIAELNKIEKLINEAINNEQFKIFIEGTLHAETISALKKEEYKIEVGGRYNELDTVIHW
jgi:pentose-5-phosphate-3-epimerase